MATPLQLFHSFLSDDPSRWDRQFGCIAALLRMFDHQHRRPPFLRRRRRRYSDIQDAAPEKNGAAESRRRRADNGPASHQIDAQKRGITASAATAAVDVHVISCDGNRRPHEQIKPMVAERIQGSCSRSTSPRNLAVEVTSSRFKHPAHPIEDSRINCHPTGERGINNQSINYSGVYPHIRGNNSYAANHCSQSTPGSPHSHRSTINYHVSAHRHPWADDRDEWDNDDDRPCITEMIPARASVDGVPASYYRDRQQQMHNNGRGILAHADSYSVSKLNYVGDDPRSGASRVKSLRLLHESLLHQAAHQSCRTTNDHGPDDEMNRGDCCELNDDPLQMLKDSIRALAKLQLKRQDAMMQSFRQVPRSTSTDDTFVDVDSTTCSAESSSQSGAEDNESYRSCADDFRFSSINSQTRTSCPRSVPTSLPVNKDKERHAAVDDHPPGAKFINGNAGDGDTIFLPVPQRNAELCNRNNSTISTGALTAAPQRNSSFDYSEAARISQRLQECPPRRSLDGGASLAEQQQGTVAVPKYVLRLREAVLSRFSTPSHHTKLETSHSPNRSTMTEHGSSADYERLKGEAGAARTMNHHRQSNLAQSAAKSVTKRLSRAFRRRPTPPSVSAANVSAAIAQPVASSDSANQLCSAATASLCTAATKSSSTNVIARLMGLEPPHHQLQRRVPENIKHNTAAGSRNTQSSTQIINLKQYFPSTIVNDPSSGAIYASHISNSGTPPPEFGKGRRQKPPTVYYCEPQKRFSQEKRILPRCDRTSIETESHMDNMADDHCGYGNSSTLKLFNRHGKRSDNGNIEQDDVSLSTPPWPSASGRRKERSLSMETQFSSHDFPTVVMTEFNASTESFKKSTEIGGVCHAIEPEEQLDRRNSTKRQNSRSNSCGNYYAGSTTSNSSSIFSVDMYGCQNGINDGADHDQLPILPSTDYIVHPPRRRTPATDMKTAQMAAVTTSNKRFVAARRDLSDRLPQQHAISGASAHQRPHNLEVTAGAAEPDHRGDSLHCRRKSCNLQKVEKSNRRRFRKTFTAAESVSDMEAAAAREFGSHNDDEDLQERRHDTIIIPPMAVTQMHSLQKRLTKCDHDQGAAEKQMGRCSWHRRAGDATVESAVVDVVQEENESPVSVLAADGGYSSYDTLSSSTSMRSDSCSVITNDGVTATDGRRWRNAAPETRPPAPTAITLTQLHHCVLSVLLPLNKHVATTVDVPPIHTLTSASAGSDDANASAADGRLHIWPTPLPQISLRLPCCSAFASVSDSDTLRDSVSFTLHDLEQQHRRLVFDCVSEIFDGIRTWLLREAVYASLVLPTSRPIGPSPSASQDVDDVEQLQFRRPQIRSASHSTVSWASINRHPDAIMNASGDVHDSDAAETIEEECWSRIVGGSDKICIQIDGGEAVAAGCDAEELQLVVAARSLQASAAWRRLRELVQTMMRSGGNGAGKRKALLPESEAVRDGGDGDRKRKKVSGVVMGKVVKVWGDGGTEQQMVMAERQGRRAAAAAREEEEGYGGGGFTLRRLSYCSVTMAVEEAVLNDLLLETLCFSK